MVLPALAVLALATWVEKRAAQPVVPLAVIRQKVPALAIIANLAVGMAMFGGAVFLGQYFQIGRGYTPTEAGLVMIPMMAGVLGASIVSGRLITRTGKIKPYVIIGAVLLVGAGVGMTMQNLVLAVQNAVALRELGASSGAVTFFRSLGGTAGVAVLGAVLANRVAETITQNLTRAGIPVAPGGGGGTLDLASLPETAEAIEAIDGTTRRSNGTVTAPNGRRH